MTQVNALYQDGVFKPLQEVDLPENQRVRLTVQSVKPGDVQVWLAQIEQRHQRIIAERGYFPDSALDIAEDRKR